MLSPLALGLLALLASGCGWALGSPDPEQREDDGTTAEPDDGVLDLCTPGEGVCGEDHRTMNICDSTGDRYDRVSCPFTCEGDGRSHCTVASNIPESEQAACGPARPLSPAAGARIVLESIGNGRITCEPHCGDGTTMAIDAAGIVDQGDLYLVWFCLSDLLIPDGVTVTAESDFPGAVAFLVTGSAVVAGRIEFDGRDSVGSAAAAGGPGGAPGGAPARDSGGVAGGGSPGCGGGGGGWRRDGLLSPEAGGGGGGGGHGSAGGRGGDGLLDPSVAVGGTGGRPCGNEELTPLAGGSGGGGGGDGLCEGACGWPGGGGGGALQISAREEIAISGTISAAGGEGVGDLSEAGGGSGGGAGGAILIEAPVLTIATGTLIVDGGAGGIGDAGQGGAGGAGLLPAGFPGAAAVGSPEGGSGGGGGGGRVRLNASTQLGCPGVTSPDAACTSGSLKRADGK